MVRSIDKYERTSNINLHIDRFDEQEIVFYVRKQMFHVPLMTVVRAICHGLKQFDVLISEDLTLIKIVFF